MRLDAKIAAPSAFLLLVLAWVFFLRWPYLDRPAWNLDEGTHATVARVLLDGGVLYKDAVDHRTPLTYYAVAAVFALAGVNNMWALHVLLAGMVALTAFGLYLVGRRWRGPGAGAWAAAIFVALSTNLFYIGDTYALNTEWFLSLFTTWATWWFWRNWERPSLWRAALVGVGYAAAFLSKQPGLLDFGAPVLTILFCLGTGRLQARDGVTWLIGLCAGMVGATALVFAYFWAKGALADFYYYAWTFNLVYYGPETDTMDRWRAALGLVWNLQAIYPVIGGLALLAAVVALFRLVQLRLNAEERRLHPAQFYLLAWTAFSWAAASSSGRSFAHYFIQVLPGLALLGGWLLADGHAWWNARPRWFVRLPVALAWLAAGWSVIVVPGRGAWPASLDREASEPLAAYVRAHSRAQDRIFVWGYEPDFYLYADRAPASRFIYCTILTGMMPWTNTAPDRDTRYAVAPDAMNTLLRDLEWNPPEYMVDASVSNSRGFAKYPLANFSRLNAFVQSHYLMIEPDRIGRLGYRLYQLKDSARRQPRALSGGPGGGAPAEPTISGPPVVNPAPHDYVVSGAHAGSRLQRLELLVDGQPQEALTFEPTERMSLQVRVPFDRLGAGRHELRARATTAGGETILGPPFLVECMAGQLPPGQLVEFGLTRTGQPLVPEAVRAPFGAQAHWENGRLIFAEHAPSSMSYPLDGRAVSLRGRFGFFAGAWAASNPGATDGADFLIEILRPDGGRELLLQRSLRPTTVPADRGDQLFELVLPPRMHGRLVFTITNGPSGNPASDWTYWSDLLLVEKP